MLKSKKISACPLIYKGHFFTKLLLISIVILLFSEKEQLYAQDEYFQDTVWTKKTDQSAGIFQVKFSNDDSMIYAKGLEMSLFFDMETGEEIKRIDGNEEVFFFNDDQNFIKLNEDRVTIEIFNTETFEIIDSLENDGNVIIEYSKCDLSDNEMYFVAPIDKGFRIWDISSGKISKTKLFPDEEYLVSVGVGKTEFTADGSRIITQYAKSYKYPGDEDVTTYGCFMVFDFETLDSIDCYPNSNGFILSNTNQYIAYGTGNKDYGVELYDFQSKELLHQIPINGPSLTGIEFSPDDKFLVTSNGPGANCLKIWSTEKGEEVYSYNDGGYSNFSISYNSELIIASIGRHLLLYPANWQGNPVEDPIEAETLIYPNPTTGTVTLTYSQPTTEATNIYLTDIEGNYVKEILNDILDEGEQNINFDVNDLANGSYYVIIENSQQNKIMKLIVEK